MHNKAIRQVPIFNILEVINMPRKINPDHINHAIELYKSGLTVKECAAITGLTEALIYKRVAPLGIPNSRRKTRDQAAQKAVDLILNQGTKTSEACRTCGIAKKVLYRYCKRAGVSLPTKYDRAIGGVDTSQIIPMYESGIGINGIARRLGVSFRPITKFLEDRGYASRNPSEQQFARMAAATPEEIANLTRKAHEASRGRKAGADELIARANARAGKVHPQSPVEQAVFAIVSRQFPEAFPALPIDRYNADIAIGRVTVEIFGGGWSVSNQVRISRYVARCKEIGDLGYHTIFFIALKPQDIGQASNLISTIHQARRLPATPGKYWVVWGDRHVSSGLCCDLDDRAFIRPFVNVRDRTTGQYVSVPR